MDHARQFYIDGKWVEPITPALLDVADPSTEENFTQIAVGSAADVDRAVKAARKAFASFSLSTKQDRIELLRAMLREYKKREGDIAEALTREMGAPLAFARSNQAPMGTLHLERMIRDLEEYRFEWMQGSTLIAKEAIGVVGMITPWNWPINQIACKVGPGDRRRLHDDPETVRNRSDFGRDLDRGDGCGRRAARRLQHGFRATARRSARRCRRTPTST